MAQRSNFRLPHLPLPKWSANPRIGLGLIIAASLITIAVAVTGPSAVVLKLGPRTSLLPPFYFPISWLPLNEWVAVPAIWISVISGALGLWVCWRAINHGWRPDNRKLFALGATLSVATSLVPPLCVADVLMYAAYGRIQVLGLNPYDITPAEIFRQAYDPVLIWTERPWQDTPSVYGPTASASQYVAAWLGNGNMHDTVFWLQMMALIPFLVIGALVVKLAHDDPKIQTRAVLFTVMNPLMIWAVLAGAHNEAFTLLFAIIGLWFIRRSPFMAGVAIGLAGTIKVSLIFYGIAMAWGYRRDWRSLVQLVAGAAIPLGLAYGLWMPNALLAAQRNVGYISAGSWGPWIQQASAYFFGKAQSYQITTGIGWVSMVIVAWMLSRLLPWRLVPGRPDHENPQRDPLTITVRTTVVLTTAWLVTSPYSLGWYDLITWVPLGLMWASRLDVMMIWRGVWLALAYVTGRSLEFGHAMLQTSIFIRDIASASAQVIILSAIVYWWWTWGHELPRLPRVSMQLHPPRGSAGSGTSAN